MSSLVPRGGEGGDLRFSHPLIDLTVFFVSSSLTFVTLRGVSWSELGMYYDVRFTVLEGKPLFL